MNFLRNGSFELGNENFWGALGSGTHEIQTDTIWIGAYALKVDEAGIGTPGVHSLDYEDVMVGDVIDLHAWVRSTPALGWRMRIYTYDADGMSIDYHDVGWLSGATTWKEMFGQYHVPSGVSYIRVGVGAVIAAGTADLYIDGIEAQKVHDMTAFMIRREIANLSNLTASGNTSAAPFNLYGGESYYAEVECTSITGTNPTLDIEVCELDSYGNERILGVFTQITAAANQRVGIARPIGSEMYINYTEGGTWTDCDFKVSVIGVR